ncbi:Sperm-associated antigen 4 protein, partial [Colius striatus]
GATIDMKRTFKTYWCKWNWFYNMLKRGCAEDGPDTILQMDVSLGKRWCFPGHYGRVVIRLPAPVHPTAIAVQHVTKEGSLSVAASSAPRDVAVYGLGADGDEEAWHTYDVEKEDIQAFHLKNTLHPRAFSYIKVLILNNWGNSEYICTSRVWVHGKM